MYQPDPPKKSLRTLAILPIITMLINRYSGYEIEAEVLGLLLDPALIHGAIDVFCTVSASVLLIGSKIREKVKIERAKL
jgi:hypothetical protein